MSEGLAYVEQSFPSRVADLGFVARLPADWVVHELPAEEVDFAEPTAFFPLGVVTAPHAAIVFAFAARPAYDDGTLLDWARYLLEHEGLVVRAIGRDVVAGVAALSGEAIQETDLGPMLVRFAFLEDGGRLINLTFTAPEMFANTVRDAWFTMLRSFALETPRGSRFPVEDHPDTVILQASPGKPADGATVGDARSGETLTGAASAPDAPSVRLTAQPKRTLFDFAFAPDAAALDPAHAVNVELRESGKGFVPTVSALDESRRRASVVASTIMAQIDVPFGWHVVDDGRRVLVFAPDGAAQIMLDLLPREGRSNRAILDGIEAQIRRERPEAAFERLRDGPIHAIGISGIAVGERALAQYHMLYPFRDQSMLLRACVTAMPEHAQDVCDLAALMFDGCAFDAYQQTDDDVPARGRLCSRGDARVNEGQASGDGPGWWQRALALDAAGQPEAAEATILQHCPHVGAFASIAEMYRRGMHRLMAAGDAEGAAAAFRRSSAAMTHYASLATSGGEGAALSAERDAFRALLVSEFGSDPDLAS